MINFANLLLDIYPLKYKLEVEPIRYFRHTKISNEEINPEFIDLLKSNDIHIFYAEFFYSPPYYIQPIHVDAPGGDIVKINFVLGGANSTMSWYKEKPNIIVPIKKTSVGTSYTEYTIDQVELIETHTIGFPSLVQVGIPHRIVNAHESRICASFVCKDKLNTPIPMTTVITKLQKYI